MSRAHGVVISAEPNVTPMIDVLLVLLIIFMAAIPSARQTVDAQLPPDQQTPETFVVPIVLEVAPAGRYAVNRKQIPATDLASYLRSLYVGRPDKTIVVRGDREASYQEVITAMDVARGAGVTVIGVDTREK